MLRFISKLSNIKLATLITPITVQYSYQIQSHSDHNPNFPLIRPFSSDHDKPPIWNISSEKDGIQDSLFSQNFGTLSGFSKSYNKGDPFEHSDKPTHKEEHWSVGGEDRVNDVFGSRDEAIPERDSLDWETAVGYKPWTISREDANNDAFDIGESEKDAGMVESNLDSGLEEKKLLEEEQELKSIIKGPNRAFGDLVAASGITNAMLDNLIALKDFEGIEGLPPLSELNDIRYQNNTKKSIRRDIERQKQEEVANSRVRQVDDKGRAYGTGRRKCSIARVWVQPGDGNFIVNDKQFDAYFPDLDHRAALLRPFTETKTLGIWDVNCTVKGGGTSGQVGAIRLGISRALQCWEPGLRPLLKEAGFLTRDPRVVERKKPGKAKARKSFQWVKR